MTLSKRCAVHARKASEEGWHTTEGVLLQASIELEQRDELLDAINDYFKAYDADKKTIGKLERARDKMRRALTKAGAQQ